MLILGIFILGFIGLIVYMIWESYNFWSPYWDIFDEEEENEEMENEIRELDEHERRLLQRARKQASAPIPAGAEAGLKVSFLRQDNYTVALVHLNQDYGFKTLVGVAKRNPIDPYVEAIGEKVAFSRAIGLGGQR